MAAPELARYADTERRELGPARRLGATPLPATELPPGSYRLTLTVAGRDPVLYPILLERAEHREVRVEIPAVVPPGMVFVPAGRFLYGSGDPEAIRLILQAQPLHPVELPGYFIGRHEVTFAEWIELLRALPSEERRRRTPTAVADENGTVQLEEVATGWRLTLQGEPGGPTLTAQSGAPIHYPARRRRASQDWLSLPVTAISWDDVLAYAAWLDRTGRLPGARPCTEREWERAARGADDRHYPHGDALGPDDANFDSTYGQTPGAYGPDEVGSHPASNSPFGVSDLTGNVWEWARSLQKEQVVSRSATFYRDRTSNQIINRNIGATALRHTQIGARMCADVPRNAVRKER
jgi:formylglycine-generating enzyme required for sulfatase activity